MRPDLDLNRTVTNAGTWKSDNRSTVFQFCTAAYYWDVTQAHELNLPRWVNKSSRWAWNSALLLNFELTKAFNHRKCVVTTDEAFYWQTQLMKIGQTDKSIWDWQYLRMWGLPPYATNEHITCRNIVQQAHWLINTLSKWKIVTAYLVTTHY